MVNTTEYERGFVNGAQHQMKSSVDKAVNSAPTKLLGPNLVEILNSAGFYRKRPWVGLTEDERQEAYYKIDTWDACVDFVEAKLKEKNT